MQNVLNRQRLDLLSLRKSDITSQLGFHKILQIVYFMIEGLLIGDLRGYK